MKYLEDAFGTDAIFFDAKLRGGVSLSDTLPAQLRSCDTFLAIIGENWVAESADRLHDVNDWVRLELELARGMGIPIFPVLISDARMPPRGQLPGSLAWLHDVKALRIRGGSDCEQDVESLIRDIGDLPRSLDDWFVLSSSTIAYLIPRYLREGLGIGRAEDADIVIDDGSISREHAMIYADRNGNHLLIDKSSSNGTFVNGVVVSQEPRKLRVFDKLLFGKCLFQYEELETFLAGIQSTATTGRAQPLGSSERETIVEAPSGSTLRTSKFDVGQLIESAVRRAVPGLPFAFLACVSIPDMQALTVQILTLAERVRLWVPRLRSSDTTVPGHVTVEIMERMEIAAAFVVLVSADSATTELACQCADVARRRSIPLIVLNMSSGNTAQLSVPRVLAGARTFYAADGHLAELVPDLVAALPPELRYERN